MLAWMQESWHVGLTKGLSAGVRSKRIEYTGFLNKTALKYSTFRHLSMLTGDEQKKMAMRFLQAGTLPALCWCYTQQNGKPKLQPTRIGCNVDKFVYTG